MSWIKHHSQSEEYASQAEIALRNGDIDVATELYRLAAEEEVLALAALDPKKARTLGITAVSAASLWYKASDFRKVERIACEWLATDDLPGFALLQLQTILQAAWNERLFRESGVEFVKGEVLVSVGGGEVVTGAAPLEIIHRKVNQIRNIFYRTTEWRLNLPFRKRGAPRQNIQEQFRPWLLQAPPGSYQFGVRVQKPAQMTLFPDTTVEIEEITSKFLEILHATSYETHEELEKIVSDPEYRIGFLKLARDLSPTGKTFDRLEIKSATDLEAPSTVFVPKSRQDINTTLREARMATEAHTELKEEELRGILRAVHLDRDWIELSPEVGGSSIRINQTGDVIDDIVGPMVNHRVIVSAALQLDGTYLYRDIEFDE